MKCPKCGGKTTVIETVTTDDTTHRRKLCRVCKHRFYTIETITPLTVEYSEAYAAKRRRLEKEKMKNDQN